MREDPYPSRFYPRLDDEPEWGGDGLSTVLVSGAKRDLRRILSFLLAAYLLFALLFTLTTQADAAALPQGSDSAAPAVWLAADEACAGLGKLAVR